MIIKVVSVQNSNRESQSSILRLYNYLLLAKYNVEYVSVGNDFFHKLIGRDKRLRDIFCWRNYLTFSFFYFPGLIKFKPIDKCFSNLWARSYLKKLKLYESSPQTVLVFEAGVTAVMVREIMKSPLIPSIHYRVNDPIDAFRSPSAYVRECHDYILKSDISELVISSPAPSCNPDIIHIPPGCESISMRHTAQKQILYWGVFPISRDNIVSIMDAYPSAIVKYTGHQDHQLKGTEYLGILAPESLSELISDTCMGVMIFPDDRFHWWLWSNKMMLMKSLKMPVIGMLSSSALDVYAEFPNDTQTFVEHGLIRLGQEVCEQPSTVFPHYDWGTFSKKIIGDSPV